ncbi:MAG: primosomal protein N' [Bacteroidetes bacterium]|nr:primosomal protein N' [Bacteroidota bacterium]
MYVDVILPLPLPGSFTYAVPPEFADKVGIGCRVVVQFGNRKIYTALVRKIHSDADSSLAFKDILSVLDNEALVKEWQFRFWDWMASYYMCTTGEVMNAALPSAFKLASETRVAINPDYRIDSVTLNEKEFSLVETLYNSKKSIEISRISRIIGQQKIIPVVKTLIEKGIVLLEEEVREKYRPKKEYFIKLEDAYSNNEAALKELFDHLEKRAKKQLEILMHYIQISRHGFDELHEVKKVELLKKSACSAAVLDSLIKKGVFKGYEKTAVRETKLNPESSPGSISLSDQQNRAIKEIRDAWTEKDVVLLHGVTSSGKTEIYIKLINDILEQGRQVLFLLPEIALTTQIINRLRKYFGDKVGVYHSRFNDAERAEVWKRASVSSKRPGGSASYDIILGARSAVFLPFADLGLVIVDEEHDSSFKQVDPAPRYNGRDAALFLAHLHGVKALLGSATPAIETYYNSQQGKYALVELPERFGEMELPLIQIVNIREELRRGRMKTHFSATLLDQLAGVLQNREQAILFQNRRGFSLRLECEACHWMPMCKNCDVTLVYHKKSNQLRCHYCGYESPVPSVCPVCQSTGVKMKGFGTEKVEEELGIFLPEAKIARMDLDTTRSRHAYQTIITGFEEQKIDILVGTQMVTKGLDFDHVSTVCILNADNMLNFPDFRSEERSFQLMAQVSGRSGRKKKRGTVIIQTYNPAHPIIQSVMKNDYTGMFKHQLTERRKFKYPPFYRLILLRIKHRNPQLVDQAASDLAKKLSRIFGNRILGPEYPPVSRIMNQYLKHIIIKVEIESSVILAKSKLLEIIGAFYQKPEFHPVRVLIDVDPQ